jgi:hypothetical protein
MSAGCSRNAATFDSVLKCGLVTAQRFAETSARPPLETARPLMEAMIESITGVPVVSLHHDISAAPREEVVIFTLALRPRCRERGKRLRILSFAG